MTRINLVDPSELADQHLIAEYREIRLLCGSFRVSMNSKRGIQVDKIPPQFTLMDGHIRFFHNKGEYIHKRYKSLRDEASRRGFNCNLAFPIRWPKYLFNDWTPSQRDLDLVRDRIRYKLLLKPEWYRYYGKPLTPSFLKRYNIDPSTL